AFEIFDAEGGGVLATVSPGICVTMVRAYGEVGRFDEATRYQALLEESSEAMEPPAAAVVNGARLSYLANLGRVEALEGILDANLPVSGMTRQRRRLFFALALSRRGRVDEARSIWLSVLADEAEDPQAAAIARDRLREPDGIVAPDPLPDATSILVEIVTVRAGVYREAVHRPQGFLRVAPMTVALLVSIVGVHAVVALWGGGAPEPLDPWVLLRYGANFSVVSLGSEPWRLVASMFLHANLLHLGTNAVGLYMLGRFTEQVFGSWRMLVIYAVSGLAGSVTSATMSSGLLSVGASGAIFGLLGAALVGLHGLRGQVPDRWRRQLTINLVIVVGLQVLIGFRFTMIDNAAHLGGFAGGAVAAWVFGFRGPEERGLPALALFGGRVYVAGFLSIAFIAAVGVSAWMASQESVTALLAHIPSKRVDRVGLVVRVPHHWYVADPRQGLSFQDPLLKTGPTFLVKAPETIAKAQRRPLWRLAGEIAKAQVAALRRQDHAIDVHVESRQPRKVAPDLMCIELRLRSGVQVRHHLIYVKLRGDVLLVMHAMLPPPRLRAYLPSLDRVAMSAWLKGYRVGKLSAVWITKRNVFPEIQGV
ncbi:MAG: rhomboid family intramembrane serine protease, partial [Deltaproteobacteria bacterium]|nr:rhomboid family intramembrane serine protease [Deltaproteobacteria bacterium]